MATPTAKLPDELDELRRLLDERLAHFQAMIGAAERARADLLLDYARKFDACAARLASLGTESTEPASWAAILRAELGRLEGPQGGASGSALLAPAPLPVLQPVESAVLAIAPEPSAPASIEPAHEIILIAPAPDLPNEAASAPPLRPSATSAEEIEAVLPVIAAQVEALDREADTTNPQLLAAEIEVVVADLRERQSGLSVPPTTSLDKNLTFLFGRLTRFCQERLNPRGIWIESLRRDFQVEWGAYAAEARRRLETARAEAARIRAANEARRKETERAAQMEAANRRRLEQAIDELETRLATNGDSDPFFVSELHEDLAEAARYLAWLENGQEARLFAAVDRIPGTLRDELLAGRAFRSLRKRLRKRLGGKGGNGEGGEAAADREPAISSANDGASGVVQQRASPEADRFRGHFAGQRGLMVGALSDDERLRKVKEHFGFAELDWIEHHRTERADYDGVARRVRSGSIDVVIVFARFMAHNLFDAVRDAARETGVPLVTVDRGLGVVAICRALAEDRRALPPATPELAARGAG